MSINIPNFCACGHPYELHTPMCTQCTQPHAFNPDAVIVATPMLPEEDA